MSQQEQHEEFLRKRSYAQSLFEEDTTIEEILQRIYIESLESKSDTQAEIMANHVVETIDMIFQTRDSLRNNPGSVAQRLNLALDGVSPEQKAEKLMSASYVFENIESLVQNGKLDSAPLKSELEEFIKRGVNESSINSLLERTVSAVSNDKTAEVLLDAFKGHTSEEIRGITLAETKNDPRALLAVDSMILYTMAVNGRLEGVKKDISLFEVTAGVCLADALNTLEYDKREGNRLLREIRENLSFILLSLVIIAAVSAVVAVFFKGAAFVGVEAVLTGILCVAFCSAALIKLAYKFFYNCMNCEGFEIPLVKFSQIANEARDRISSQIQSAELTEVQETDDNTVCVNNDDLQNDECTENLYLALFEDT